MFMFYTTLCTHTYKKISRGYDIYKFCFISDVYRYYKQTLRSTIDHKEGKEFSVVSFYQFVYSSVKFLLANAILTNR